MSSKIPAFKISIPRGSDYTFKPLCTAVVGTDMTNWTSEFVVKNVDGEEMFRKESPITIPTPGTLNVGEASFSLTETETAMFENKTVAAHYHVTLIDAATEWTGVVLWGAIEAYVDSGGD